jgi:hypothetical protein
VLLLVTCVVVGALMVGGVIDTTTGEAAPPAVTVLTPGYRA